MITVLTAAVAQDYKLTEENKRKKKRGVSESNREFIFIFLEWILRSGNSGFVFLHGFNDLVLVLSFLLTVKKKEKRRRNCWTTILCLCLVNCSGFSFFSKIVAFEVGYC